MANTTTRKPKMAQMYDKETIRERWKIVSGFIFSWDELVRTDVIDSKTVLNLNAEKLPDECYFNGKPCKIILEVKDKDI